jgi:hypothetical protein
MTDARDDLSLSRIELVVLARLSTKKPPRERELGDAVLELALPSEPPARGREVAMETLAALRGRALVSEQARALTEDGRRALRAAFGLARAPTWTEVRDIHLPALALGLKPGSEHATRTLQDASTIAAAVLRAQLGLRDASRLMAVCDALVAEALGLPPGPLTLNRIRSHVLARRVGVEAKGKPMELAMRVAAGAVRARRADKKSMARALGRRWVQQAEVPSGAQSVQPSQRPPPVQLAPPAAPEVLLEVVRETLPRVGHDGRYGAEKVFVSAIWHSIARDHRLAELTLDRFKRWLVTANRDGWLALARADLVGAMDADLVAESEIEDQGATFHFVLDRSAGAPGAGRGNHAR